MLRDDMRTFATALFVIFLFALTACSSNNDNAHTTATTIVPPPPRQELHISTRPSPKLAPTASHQAPNFDPQKPWLTFDLTKGGTYRENEEVVIDFSLANAKLKGDGGDYRVRYIVDDEEMRWIDRWEQVVLTGWTPGKHTIRLELVGPDGWPYKNGDYNVVTRQLTIAK
jgi:hypothetical protein